MVPWYRPYPWDFVGTRFPVSLLLDRHLDNDGIHGSPPRRARDGQDAPDVQPVNEGLAEIDIGTPGPHQAPAYDDDYAENTASEHEDEQPHLEPGSYRDLGAARARAHARTTRKINKKTRARLTIASMNMRGLNSQNMQAGNKWQQINQLMKEDAIGVLALQETHLTTETVERLKTLYQRRLHISWTSAEEHAEGQQGVAIVLNKNITNIKGVKVHVLVPGRAMLMSIPWHDNLTVNILNVYAPNDMPQNARFWNSLNEKWQTDRTLPIPDILLGDFNIVEDPIDRIPARADDTLASDAGTRDQAGEPAESERPSVVIQRASRRLMSETRS